MKLLKTISTSIVAISIAACSNAPSENDAKNSVKNLLGNCSYLALENFKKINGIPSGERGYRVDIKYSINMTPTPSNIKLSNDVVLDLKKISVDLDRINLENTQYENDKSEYLKNNLGSSISGFEIDNKDKYYKMQDNYKLSEYYKSVKADGPYRIRVALKNNFIKECPGVGVNVLDNLFTTKVAIDKYSENTNFDYSYTMNMVRTDNGWQEVR